MGWQDMPSYNSSCIICFTFLRGNKFLFSFQKSSLRGENICKVKREYIYFTEALMPIIHSPPCLPFFAYFLFIA